MSGWGVIGHEWVVRLLEQSLEREHISHAYLLLGPPRVGKTTLAVALAKALNCAGEREPGSHAPCGACRSCRLIHAGRHPDVHLVEGGAVRAILIDQVREIQHEVALSPVEARHRVVILTDFQGATTEAANCLLKTLEEPPGQVVLILTASEPGRLLPTIVSRCQPLWLRAPSAGAIAEGLVARLSVPAELAGRLARLSGGRVGWAVEAARDPAVLEERSRQLERVQEIARADILARLRWAKELSGDSDRLPALLECWSGWWRDLLLWKTGCRDLIANVDQTEALARAQHAFDVPGLVAGLQALNRARRSLESNANPRLTLEVLFLAMEA